jgi:large subunit ribosomal protein L4
VKKLARKSALSQKAKDQKITVVENLKMDAKTKEFVGFLKNVKATEEKVLVVIPSLDRNVVLSARNLKKASVLTANDLNTYDIMNAGRIILTEGSFEAIEKMFNN